MRTSRKILGTVIALSIAIGSIPLVRIPTKAEDNDGAVTPRTEVKMIMRGVGQIIPQSTTVEVQGEEYKYTCDKGSSIYFGSYPQTKLNEEPKDDTGKNVDWVQGYSGEEKDQYQGYYSIDPIEWRVLTKGEEDMLLLSDKNLDTVKFYDTTSTVLGINYTWDQSTIRSWLNGYDGKTGGYNNLYGKDYSDTTYGTNFLKTAFTEKEISGINDQTQVTADANPYHTGIETGIDTKDRIFLLSAVEAIGAKEENKYGFETRNEYSGNKGRYYPTDNHKTYNTDYVEDGCGKTGYSPAGSGGAGWWWLRSPGCYEYFAAVVDSDGSVNCNGYSVSPSDVGVRPAFKLNLKSVLFTSAAEGSKSADEVGKSPAAEGGGEIGLKNGDIPTIPVIGKYEQKDSQGNTIDGKDWKLTMLDNTRNNFTASAVKVGNVLTIDYKGATVPTGDQPKNEYISVILANNDNTGAFTHYLTAAQLDGTTYGTSGTVKVRIPENVDMSKKTLFVINEQQNGDYKTDFSSDLEAVECKEVTVDGEPGENGWYKGSVTITAPDGYQIRKKNGVYGTDNFIVYDTENKGEVTYYLKKQETTRTADSEGEIEFTKELNIDLYPPDRQLRACEWRFTYLCYACRRKRAR